MPNRSYRGRESPITGMFFLTGLGRDPIILRVDGILCVPVFSSRETANEAEQSFHLPHGQVRMITDGNRFYDVYHHDFRIVLDPRMVEGQCRYDEIQVDPDPQEVS
jgi:hypothetical protein